MGKWWKEAQCPVHGGTTCWLLVVFGEQRIGGGEKEYGFDSRDRVGLVWRASSKSVQEGFLEVAALRCCGKKWGGWRDREYTVQRLRRER